MKLVLMLLAGAIAIGGALHIRAQVNAMQARNMMDAGLPPTEAAAEHRLDYAEAEHADPVRGKRTVIVVTRADCKPSLEMVEAMTWLLGQRTDLAVRKLDASRYGPVDATPHLIIHELDGRRYEGKAAKDLARHWHREAATRHRQRLEGQAADLMDRYRVSSPAGR